MADLLTHVLVAYSVAVVLSWRLHWITTPYVTALMVGSTLPDLTRIGLLIDPGLIERTGIPFSYSPLHTLGGALITFLIISLTTVKNFKPVSMLLGLGVLTHFALDLLLINASGHSFTVLWPLTAYRPPTPGLYLSTDLWPALLAGAVALVVWYTDSKRRFGSKNIYACIDNYRHEHDG